MRSSRQPNSGIRGENRIGMRTESQSPAEMDGGISFFCVARGSTILHSRSGNNGAGGGDPELEALAAACLAKTPPLHVRYSHTARDRTFAFLIDGEGEGRTYFAIADAAAAAAAAAGDSGGALRFLERLRDAFERGGAEGLAPREEGAKEGAIEVGKGNGNGGDRGIRIAEGCEEKPGRRKGLGRSLSVRARARKVWWRHVRVVLALDALLCVLLLGAWLAVCRGLKCLS